MPAIQYNGRTNNKAKNIVHSPEGVRLLETDGAARLMVAYLRDLTLGHALSNRFYYCHIGCLLNLSILILTFRQTVVLLFFVD